MTSQYHSLHSICNSVVGHNQNVKLHVGQKNGSGSKELPIGKISTRGPMKKRVHPWKLSTQNHASAHYSAVIGLKVYEDDMYLLSAGSFLFANTRIIRIIHTK